MMTKSIIKIKNKRNDFKKWFYENTIIANYK